MPDAKITTISKAVATSLNSPEGGVTFSKEFTAERVHVPEYDTQKLNSLKVFVVGSSHGINLDEGNRRDDNKSYSVMVGFYNTIKRDSTGKPDMDEVDAMDYLVEQVRDYFVGLNQFGSVTDLYLASLKNDVPYDPGTLTEKGVYVSVITLTFTTYA
jgi:hypothetical protein